VRHRPIVLTVFLGILVAVWSFQNGYGPVALGLATVGLGLVQVADERRRAKAARIREALAKCEPPLSLSDAAALARMDLAEFSRMLTGERKLDGWRLEMLGDEFNSWLSLLELRDRGLPKAAQRAVDVAPVLTAIGGGR
jgi:hypothetical protein